MPVPGTIQQPIKEQKDFMDRLFEELQEKKKPDDAAA